MSPPGSAIKRGRGEGVSIDVGTDFRSYVSHVLSTCCNTKVEVNFVLREVLKFDIATCTTAGGDDGCKIVANCAVH